MRARHCPNSWQLEPYVTGSRDDSGVSSIGHKRAEHSDESLSEWERGPSEVQPSPLAGAPGRKWSARSAHAQDTATDQSPPVTNGTDACKLLINLVKAEKDKLSKYLDLAHEVTAMWDVDSTIIVPIVVSANGLIAKSLDQHLKRLSLDGWIKGQIQKAVLLDTARIVRRFLTLRP
ncbi:hypothetical protein MSG28_000111 [Choristoneura fumiferana]|uniref:Uncharacterized protein n=1 Tax=Choristoneura fumiferana TaxID=7141 RepID=A0ACC0JZP3_CHOFU|nr:hypothetical protein MSG28_000111 [Choristoneura fumiferana]